MCSSDLVVTLTIDHRLMTGRCSRNLEMFRDDSLKSIFCNRNVEEKRGSSGDFIAQAAFDLEFHPTLRPNAPLPIAARSALSVFGPDDIDDLPRQRPIRGL